MCRTHKNTLSSQPGCTKCCEQQGFVYLNEHDLVRAAGFLGMTPAAFERKYVYRTRNKMRLRVPRDSQCSFLRSDVLPDPSYD